MNNETKRSFWGPFILGGMVAFLFMLLLRISASREQTMPSIAGQGVPTKSFQIDYDKRYKVICSGYQTSKDAIAYDDVKILRFVGSQESTNKGAFGSGSSYAYLDQWLVLELGDMRKVYLPSRSISIIEEVAGDNRKDL